MVRAGWQHWEHDADIGIRACGATRESLFEQFGAGLTAIITDPVRVQDEQTTIGTPTIARFHFNASC